MARGAGQSSIAQLVATGVLSVDVCAGEGAHSLGPAVTAAPLTVLNPSTRPYGPYVGIPHGSPLSGTLHERSAERHIA